MGVEFVLRDSLDTVRVLGDVFEVANELNTAAANGRRFALLNDLNDDQILVAIPNINIGRPFDEDDDDLIH